MTKPRTGAEQSAPKRRSGPTPTEAQHHARGNGRLMLRLPLTTITAIKLAAIEHKCSVAELMKYCFSTAIPQESKKR